ncbi:nuclease-related domain-containing protein [Cellulomonas fimi]|uniref:NERD domain-containing protein n=1 Tax=Cellulomonas fimi TaxID=1708 RepID=A0A7Y0LXG3_CELFI|nr:nuclease-related domain-containing protein [Cellulomonas fimi]NMR19760.1 NERD domain-containing protein [Cellulomonas fimi]
MSPTLTMRRWHRFGVDFLVATADTGARVGWVDLRSGEVVVERPMLEDSLRLAAQEYLRADVHEIVLPVPRRAALDAFDAYVTVPDDAADDASGSVAARLERLVAEGWLVLHDVPVGRQGAVLDHLLIGTGGVFAIRVHAHPDAHVVMSRTSVEVDGRPTSYLRDARLEQARVQQVLGAAAGLHVEVRPVVVLDTDVPPVLAGDALPDAALVLGRTDVPQLFREVPPRLAATRVEAIRAAAGRRSTWTA